MQDLVVALARSFSRTGALVEIGSVVKVPEREVRTADSVRWRWRPSGVVELARAPVVGLQSTKQMRIPDQSFWVQ